MSGLPYLKRPSLTFLNMHIKLKHFSYLFNLRKIFGWWPFFTQNSTVHNNKRFPIKHFVPWPVFCSDHSDHISIWYLTLDLCNLRCGEGTEWNWGSIFEFLHLREGGQLFTSAVVRRHSIHLSKRIKRVSWTYLTIISWVTWTTDPSSWSCHSFGCLHCWLLDWADRT